MQHRFIIVAGCLMTLLVGRAISGIHPVTDARHHQVTQIYVQAGPVEHTLPELIVQLGIPAGLVLGDLPAIDVMDPPPHRVTHPFAFQKGTVTEALNAFCALNPFISWMYRDGVILMRRRIDENTSRMEALLTAPLGEFAIHDLPLDDLMIHLTEKMAATNPRMLAGEMLPLSEQRAYENAILSARVTLDERYSFAFDHADLTAVLDEVVNDTDNSFWYAYDSTGRFEAHGLNIGVTTWSARRREMTIAQLVAALRPNNPELKGYRTEGGQATALQMRIEDAQRELIRRHHYQPRVVREALRQAEFIQTRLHFHEMEYYQAVPQLYWLVHLDDPELTPQIISKIRDMEVGNRRSGWISAIFPDAQGSLKSVQVEALWRELAAEDPDPAVRKMAQQTIRLLEKQTSQESTSG